MTFEENLSLFRVRRGPDGGDGIIITRDLLGSLGICAEVKRNSPK